MSFGSNLIRLREAAGFTRKELADRLDIPYTTLRNYETDQREPGHKTLIKLGTFFQVSVDDLIGFEHTPSARHMPIYSGEAMALAHDYDMLDAWGQRQLRSVADIELARCDEASGRLISMPIYDDPAAAGSPLDAGSGCTRIDFAEDVVPPDADFGVRIAGDSMDPTIPDGSIAFVRRAQTVRNRDIVIAWVDGEGTVCKRAIVADGDKLLRLQSDNPTYPAIAGARLHDLRIYGVVVGHVQG